MFYAPPWLTLWMLRWQAPVVRFVSVTWLVCVPVLVERHDVSIEFCGRGGVHVRGDYLSRFGWDVAHCFMPPVISVVWRARIRV